MLYASAAGAFGVPGVLSLRCFALVRVRACACIKVGAGMVSTSGGRGACAGGGLAYPPGHACGCSCAGGGGGVYLRRDCERMRAACLPGAHGGPVVAGGG